MRNSTPRPVRALAFLLVGVLPLQVGLSGLLGAAMPDHERVAPAQILEEAPANGRSGEPHRVPHDHRTDPVSDGEHSHDPDEPCGGESGICDTGLMTCSDVAPCATAFFAPSAEPVPAPWTAAAAEEPLDAPSLHETFSSTDSPPPRA